MPGSGSDSSVVASGQAEPPSTELSQERLDNSAYRSWVLMILAGDFLFVLTLVRRTLGPCTLVWPGAARWPHSTQLTVSSPGHYGLTLANACTDIDFPEPELVTGTQLRRLLVRLEPGSQATSSNNLASAPARVSGRTPRADWGKAHQATLHCHRPIMSDT